MSLAFFRQGINEHGFMAGVDAVWLFLQRVGVFMLFIAIIAAIIGLFTYDPRKEVIKTYIRNNMVAPSDVPSEGWFNPSEHFNVKSIVNHYLPF